MKQLFGSRRTYNFDGLAYSDGTGVEPASRIIQYHANIGTWDTVNIDIPMDLRGIASVSDNEKYIAGGMLSGQVVSDKLYKITYEPPTGQNLTNDEANVFYVYPNPAKNQVAVTGLKNCTGKIMNVYDSSGRKVHSQTVKNYVEYIDTTRWENGVYIIELGVSNGNNHHIRFIKM